MHQGQIVVKRVAVQWAGWAMAMATAAVPVEVQSSAMAMAMAMATGAALRVADLRAPVGLDVVVVVPEAQHSAGSAPRWTPPVVQKMQRPVLSSAWPDLMTGSVVVLRAQPWVLERSAAHQHWQEWVLVQTRCSS
jgi:hypothetical protein